MKNYMCWHDRFLVVIALFCLAVFTECATSAVLREPARGDSVMVVTAHPLATQVGVAVLRDGGHAVDAAVAVAFALAVVEPYSSGLGGGGFAVLFDASNGTVASLDFRERAPAAAHRDLFVVNGQADTKLSQTGALAVAVPGQVRGLGELHRRAGRVPWVRLLAPAVALARDGFPVTASLLERIEFHKRRFNDAAKKVFLPAGRPPEVGQLLRQIDLAATLEIIAREGPDAFYHGMMAVDLAAAVQSAGGIMSAVDLADYHCQWREPLRGHYGGVDVYTMPPPSSGGVHLIQMLNVLGPFDLTDRFLYEETNSGIDPGIVYFKYTSTPICHVLIEAMKFAFADRSRWLGDPDYVAVPVARLISLNYSDSLRARIEADRALPWREVEGTDIVPQESDHTSHVSIIDAAGCAVAMTLTINLNFGSGMVAGNSGVILNDEMDDFVAAPGVPNAFGLIGGEENGVAPGKRPLSSMTPTIALRNDRVLLVVGSPGGSRISTSVLQVVLNLIDGDMDVAQAVTAPRIHHQWYPPWVYYESDGMTSGCQADLKELGHDLQLREGIGNVQAIWIDPVTGTRTGASDPRGNGSAAGF